MRKGVLKKATSLMMAFVLLVSMIVPYTNIGFGEVSAQTMNLIANGDFESGNLNGWDTSGNAKFTVTDAEQHSGTYALQIDGPQNWNGIKYTVDVDPNTNYSLTFWGKGAKDAAIKILRASDEATIVEQYTGQHEDWHQYIINFNSGDNDSIKFYLSDAGATSYYDDFVLARVLDNLFTNGDFESGNLDGWNTSGNDKFQVTDVEKHAGEYALEIAGPQNWNGIKYSLNVTPDTDYTLTFWGKGAGGAAYKVLGSDESQITENYTGQHEDWHQYTVNFNSGSNSQIIIYVSDAGGVAYYDDFYIGDPIVSVLPTASNVAITGEAKETLALEGSFDYSHRENIAEGYSMYQWFQADAEDGEFTPIPRGFGKSFTLTEELVGKYIKLQVTPVDRVGVAGEAVWGSDVVGPVAAAALADKLQVEIDDAYNILAQSEIGTEIAQYPEEAWNNFEQAIANAEQALESGEPAQSDIDSLNGAKLAFDQARIKKESPLDTFITVDGTKIMEGDEEFKFISFNYPGALNNEDEKILPTEFEQEDAIRTIVQTGGKVFRTYTLTIRDKDDAPDKSRHVEGPGIYGEEAFKTMDKLLELANKHGVRVIIPFIDNWDWPPGGITDFAYFRGLDRMSFYEHPQLIEDFKQVIEHVMNRVNTYTGVRYKDDPAILGWETGNELMTAPEWMSEIAAFYKSVNPNQLLISGNQMELPHFYRNITVEALTDPNIDIVKSHYYEGNYANRVREDKALAAEYNKPFFVGEFGFKPTREVEAMLDEVIDNGTSGALIWSLRPHSAQGGFIPHSEYEVGGILYTAYHWPGMPSGDYQDSTNVLHLMRNKAYEIQGIDAPALPIPEPAPQLFVTDSVAQLSWQGSTGASSYIIERAETAEGPWNVLAEGVLDDVKPGGNMYSDVTAITGKDYYYRVKGINISGESDYSNVVGPVNAKYILDDQTEGLTKQYYSENDSIVYRIPSHIVMASVEATIADGVEDNFTFLMSADGIQFDPVAFVQEGTSYELDASAVKHANHLKIVYPNGDKADGVVTRVTIEYYGNGNIMTPIEPLVTSGALTEDFNNFNNMFYRSNNLDIVTDASAKASYPQMGRLQIAVGEGSIPLPKALPVEIIDGAEHYGGENLLLQQYQHAVKAGQLALLLDSTNKSAGDYSLKLQFNMNDDEKVGITKQLHEGDRSAYDTLQLWVKPDGQERVITVELADTNDNVWSKDVTVTGTNGAYINLPLDSEALELSELTSFSFYVNSGAASANGTLYIDDIRFVQTRVIDSFDAYDQLSKFNARYGTRNTGGGQITASLTDEFQSSGTHAMKVDFDMTGPGYAGLITQLPRADWSAYDAISFWLKPGDISHNVTIQVKTGSDVYYEATISVTGGAEAGIVEIPFTDFDYPSWYGGSGELDPRDIKEFNIYLGQTGETVGSFIIDQIELVSHAEDDNDDLDNIVASSVEVNAVDEDEGVSLSAVEQDSSRLVRTDNKEAFVIYRTQGNMSAFKLESYYASVPNDKQYFAFYGSADGESYEQLVPEVDLLGGDGSYKTNYQLGELPENIKFLKIVFPAASDKPDPGPGPGSGDSEPVPTEQPNNDTIVVSNPQASSDGQIVVNAGQGIKHVIIPANAAAINGKNTLSVKAGDVEIEIPAELLSELQGLVAANELENSDIYFSFEAAIGQAATTLLDKASDKHKADVAQAGPIYQFSIGIVDAKGNKHPLTQFSQNIKLVFKLNEKVDTSLVGVYYIAEDGTLEYVGGTINGGVITAEASHFSTYAPLTFKKSFVDVGADFWANEAITALAAKHIIKGISDTEFGPARSVTRAEFTTLLVRALGLKAEGEATFTDVQAGSWYAQDVAAAVEAGIVNGKSGTVFAPNAKITREEMAVMIVRAHEYRTGVKYEVKGESVFKDRSAASTWAQEAIDAAYELGLIQGKGLGSFDPKGDQLRSESAQVIWNFLTR